MCLCVCGGGNSLYFVGGDFSFFLVGEPGVMLSEQQPLGGAAVQTN